MDKENKFDPKEYLIQIKTKKGLRPYLPTAARILWFRQDHPDWIIKTEIIERVEGSALMKAEIINDKGVTLSMAHRMETRDDFEDYLEKAETNAIGRALALVGYGTQFAPELDEEERIVDAPYKKGEANSMFKGSGSKNGDWRNEEVTMPQRSAVFALLREKKGIAPNDHLKFMNEYFKTDHKTPDEFTRGQISDLITELKKVEVDLADPFEGMKKELDG